MAFFIPDAEQLWFWLACACLGIIFGLLHRRWK